MKAYLPFLKTSLFFNLILIWELENYLNELKKIIINEINKEFDEFEKLFIKEKNEDDNKSKENYLVIWKVNYADEFDYSIISLCSKKEIEIAKKNVRDLNVQIWTNEEVYIPSSKITEILNNAIKINENNKEEVSFILKNINWAYIDIINFLLGYE